ncbi:MAG: alpha/beta fold hydrolase [Phycisphaerae bacterium]|nr:alpha/beta fold hydrolase [Phycisphaerae bacterium]
MDTQSLPEGSIMMRRFLVVGVLLVAGLSAAARGEDGWPRFRGPNADGVAPDHAGLPTKWTNTENVKWVADVPGRGWSSPIVWGNRVFLTAVDSEKEGITPKKGLYQGEGVRDPAKGIHHWLVYCLDLDSGQQLWKHEAHTGEPKVPRHPKNTYASETPTTDGQRLYVLFGDLGLYCYELSGDPVWSQRIEPRRTLYNYGAAASPVVHDGQVIVVYDNLESSWIAAFDARTGSERWRTLREETHSWATPFVWKNELRTEIVVAGSKRNRSYSLDGKLLWEFDGRMSSLVIPSPFAAHGLCYIASGYVGDAHRPTFAVRTGAAGNIAPGGDFEKSSFIAWYQGQSSSYNPSQLVYGDYLYTLYDRGFLTCHDAKTGKEVYGKQRFSPSGSFTASPWACGGRLFFLSEDGLTYVLKAGPAFEILERNPLGELCLASPAVVRDRLLIRTASKLYCLTEGAKLDAAAQARLQPARNASATVDVWSAVAEGNRDAVARLLAAGTPVNARQSDSGSTPLNTAAVFGQTGVAKLLLEKGADVSLANRDGNTALHIAAFFANKELVELLLDKGASVSAKNERGETSLDVVSAEWSPQLEETFKSIADLVGLELDLAVIKKARPEVAGLLRERAATTHEETTVEGFPNVLQRDISVWSDGTRLSGVLLYPKDREKGKRLPAIILCNGWGGTKAFLMGTGIAPRFADAGYVVINYDYRGWGDSDSRLVVRGEMPTPGKDGTVTVTAQAVRELVDPIDQQHDIDAAVSYVYGEPLVDKDRIGIWGTSFGGGHAIYRAAHDRRIVCVVAQVGSMPDDWAQRFPAGLLDVYKQKSDRARGLVDPVPQGGGSPGGLQGTPHPERIALFRPGQYADRVKVPTLLIDAKLENYFKIEENSGRVYEILKKSGVPTEHHVLPGKKHYDVYSGELLDEVMKLEIAWFDKHLKAEK